MFFLAIQRDIIARQLGITQEQIRIWFQNRRRIQTQRDTGERLATTNEITALQQGKTDVNSNELKKLLNDVIKYKDAPPRLRLDESS
jgi:transposase-like protein